MCRVVVKHLQALHSSFLHFCPLHGTSVNGLVPAAAVYATSLFLVKTLLHTLQLKNLSSLSLQKHQKIVCSALLNWCPVLTDVDVR